MSSQQTERYRDNRPSPLSLPLDVKKPLYTSHLHVVFRLEHQILAFTSGRVAGVAGLNQMSRPEHRKRRQGPECEVYRGSYVVGQLEGLFDVKVTQQHLQRTWGGGVTHMGQQDHAVFGVTVSDTDLRLRAPPQEITSPGVELQRLLVILHQHRQPEMTRKQDSTLLIFFLLQFPV